MKVARRMDNLQPYLFVEINKKIAEKRAKGEEVINLSAGDPDIATPPHIIEGLCKAAQDPVNHRYPESTGLPELRRAMADWYQKRFNITLDPATEVLPLIGSKDFPNRVNFEVARVLDDKNIEARVWERGVGETLACGSGTGAITVASKLLGYTGSKVDIHLRGGVLHGIWNGNHEVVIGGPAVIVYEGNWPD